MTKKLYDICASIGKLNDHNGNSKNRYINVGAVLLGEHGPFITLNAHFNPAGIQRKEDSSSIVLSLFKPKSDSYYSTAQDYSYSQDTATDNLF